MTDLQELNDDPAPIRNPRSGPMAEFIGVASRGIRGFILDESVRSSRVLVTGGTGCIGTTVVRLLAAHGVEVVSVARRPPRERQRVQGPRYRQADIADAEAIGAILHEERPDLILHVAGQRLPALAETLVTETVRTNVIGTKVLVRAAADAGVGCIVTASTGKALRFYASEVYAATKKLSEYVVARAGSGEGLSCATVRFTHVVDNSVIGRRMLGWARNNEPIRLHAPGIAFYAQSALEAA